MAGAKSGPDPSTVTTIKVRSALSGDKAAFEWIVRRFSPLLLAQARYRMRVRLQRYYDPEDVVADTWQRALPQLNEHMQPGEGRCTPRIVKFLSAIVINRVNELLREMVRRRVGSGDGGEGEQSGESGFLSERLHPDRGDPVWKPLMVHEEVTRVLAMIEDLDPRDQEVIVLRKVEGHSSQEVARRLEVSVNVVDTRLSRALERLRKRLPNGVFEELCESGD